MKFDSALGSPHATDLNSDPFQFTYGTLLYNKLFRISKSSKDSVLYVEVGFSPFLSLLTLFLKEPV